jgi:thiamine-phosphate pyrophosphorylase
VELRKRLADSRLYFICGDRPGGRDLAEVLPAALTGGVAIFQLRMKGAGDDELLSTAAIARAACDEAGALFILNDRPDLVEVTGADGVHVGQDAAVAHARATIGPGRLIGVSTHEPAQLAKAIADGADYAGVGPVNETPTKPGRPAVGLGYVRHAAEHSSIPAFAIGGLDAETVGDVIRAGATKFAVVRAIAEATDPERAARELLAAAEKGALSGAA